MTLLPAFAIRRSAGPGAFVPEVNDIMPKKVNPRPEATPEGDLRNVRPKTAKQLRRWIRDYTGIEIPDKAVCPDHQSPWECFEAIHLKRPSVALILGSRGSGKSFLSALDTHLTSRWDPDHGTRILGGSKAQSVQIYHALRDIALRHEGKKGGDSDSIAKLLKDGATYENGSEVEILAASSTSVRGPHVPSLKLDEVDEMDTDIRESAMGMCLGRKADKKKNRAKVDASVIMTSTCHRVHGPMAKLIEKAEAGAFPLYTMCVFEVLESCPEERSGPGPGPAYPKCPECPIKQYCLDVPEGVQPKAKRSNGHYPIDSLLQKLKMTSTRVFEADYLCKLSSSEAAWFPNFQLDTHVSEDAEFVPNLDVHLAVDTGVFTGAVFFQVISKQMGHGLVDQVRVFADYLSEGKSAEANARAIRDLAVTRCNGRLQKSTTDPAGNSRNAIGLTVLAEYARSGLILNAWPLGKVADGLALLDSFVTPSVGPSQLQVHPRCVSLIQAMQCYRRAKRGGQWLDRPDDPQHPYEDLVDALRGGLLAHYPSGRVPKSNLTRVNARQVM
jgi:hypothetical protein